MSALTPAASFVEAGRRLRIDSRRRWLPDLGSLLRTRQLLYMLSKRNITVRYRQTVLGSVWILIGPLLSAALFTFVFSAVAKLPSGNSPYFVFSYAGLIGWNLFASTVSKAGSSLISSSSLISKIYFPRLVLPLATVASTLINTAISLVVMVVLLFAYDIGFTLNFLLFPVWAVLAMLLAMGIGLALAAGAVLYRDVNFMTPVFTSLLLYVSPVGYATDAVPDHLQTLYLLNPITTIVEGVRWSLLGDGSITSWALVYTVGLSVGAFALGVGLFTRLESRFADVI